LWPELRERLHEGAAPLGGGVQDPELVLRIVEAAAAYEISTEARRETPASELHLTLREPCAVNLAASSRRPARMTEVEPSGTPGIDRGPAVHDQCR
jgi:hypothetical protein